MPMLTWLARGVARLILLPLQVWDDVQRALADDPWKAGGWEQ